MRARRFFIISYQRCGEAAAADVGRQKSQSVGLLITSVTHQRKASERRNVLSTGLVGLFSRRDGRAERILMLILNIKEAAESRFSSSFLSSRPIFPFFFFSQRN